MIVILHGWSDESRSFRTLAARIANMALPQPIASIFLGDYVSMDDDVSFDDIAAAVSRAWTEAGLPTSPRSVDMVVHSTGALVVRHWMTRYYTPETNPVHRLLMLAPANFGSHLAHKGTSFLGRVVKGFSSRRMFHTGKRILQGLELASEFTWRLAEQDRLDPARRWYGPGRVLATVLVGTRGYSGIAAAANLDGSDGTVLVSTANLNPARVEFDFATDPMAPRRSIRHANGDTAFCRLPGDNHSTAAFKDRGPVNPHASELVRAALSVDDASFDQHCARLAGLNAQFRHDEADDNATQGFQNAVVWVSDDFGSDVRDYFLENFAKRSTGNAEDRALTAKIQQRVVQNVHTNSLNSARRSLLFNCDNLHELLVTPQRPLYMAITASPEIKDTGTVGYSTIGYNDIGSIEVKPDDLGRVFVADRTLFVNLVIKREQLSQVATFVRA